MKVITHNPLEICKIGLTRNSETLEIFIKTFEDRSDFNNDEIVMEELYDYEIDPLETKSYASDASYQKVKEEMIKDLRSVIWEK